MRSFIKGFNKTAGGPGSGVSGDNAKVIDFLEDSPLVSIGYRKKFMSERSPDLENDMVPVKLIKYKGQEKYVPKKLEKFIKAIRNKETWPFEKAVDLLRDDDGNYHILDGHHRTLAAIITKRPRIKANVYTMNVIHKKAEEQVESDERLTFMWGNSKPTTEMANKKERLDLVDENKKNRPESFQ